MSRKRALAVTPGMETHSLIHFVRDALRRWFAGAGRALTAHGVLADELWLDRLSFSKVSAACPALLEAHALGQPAHEQRLLTCCVATRTDDFKSVFFDGVLSAAAQITVS